MTSAPAAVPARQAGLTLVELMIAITLGFVVLLAASGLLISSKSAYVQREETARLQEAGRQALEVVARSLRQAGYQDWAGPLHPMETPATLSPDVVGLDARYLKAARPGLEQPLAQAGAPSDVLAVRFFGSGSGPNGDGSIINCGGFGVPAAASWPAAEEARGWSIFYVSRDAAGEPELYCKYRGNSGWVAQAMIRGVESFQVLYGLDSDRDGIPNRFVSASTIRAIDLARLGAGYEDRVEEMYRATLWKKVVAVRLALLVRGAQAARADVSARRYDLFGEEYANRFAGADPGTRVAEAALPANVRNRIRKTFSTTVMLRNRAGGPAS